MPPSVGTITNHVTPTGIGVRTDTGIDSESEVSIYYDPILSKLITFGKDRNEALSRMVVSLKNYLITGVTTNIPFCKWIIQHPDFINNNFNINFINNELENYIKGRTESEELSEEEIASIIVSAILFSDKRKSKFLNNVVSQQNKWTIEDE